MERWSELLWKWIYRQPAESNPLLDPTGTSCAVDQQGPVWVQRRWLAGSGLHRLSPAYSDLRYWTRSAR